MASRSAESPHAPAPTSYAAMMLAASKHASAESALLRRKKGAGAPKRDDDTEDEGESDGDFGDLVPSVLEAAGGLGAGGDVGFSADGVKFGPKRRRTLEDTGEGPGREQGRMSSRGDEVEDEDGDDGDDDDDEDEDGDDEEGEELGDEDGDGEEDEDGMGDNIVFSALVGYQSGEGLHVSVGAGAPAKAGTGRDGASTSRNPPPVVHAVNDPPGGPYQCPHCVKTFSLKGNREKHVRAIHLLIRAFVCPICGHSSSYKRNLDRHILNVHHRLKPFHCPDCMRSFSQKTNIRTHLKLVHGVERPFPRPHSCRQCHMAFDTKARLRAHTAAEHHGKFAWACTLCRKGYKWRRSLRKHMAQKHFIGNLASSTIPGMVLETPGSGLETAHVTSDGNPPKRNVVAAGEAARLAAIAAADVADTASIGPSLTANVASAAKTQSGVASLVYGPAVRGRPPASVTAERAAEAAALVVASAGPPNPQSLSMRAPSDAGAPGRRKSADLAAAARAAAEATAAAATGLPLPVFRGGSETTAVALGSAEVASSLIP